MSYTHSPSFLGLKLIDLSDDTQVNSGGATNTQTLQPEEGFIYKIKSIYYYAADPSGSTSGTHRLQIRYSTTSGYGDISTLTCNTGSDAQISGLILVGDVEVPSTEIAQINILKASCDNTNTIEFKYTNSTDANQTATRTLEILVEVYKELL